MKIFKTDRILKSIGLAIGIAIATASFAPVYAEKSDREVSNRQESNRQESDRRNSNRQESNRQESNLEISEIGWSSRLTSMGLDKKKNADQKYKFECQSAPEDLIHAPIWGTRVYTSNSGICSAAVHSGMVDPEEGGIIIVKLVNGRNFYTGSKKNLIDLLIIKAGSIN